MVMPTRCTPKGLKAHFTHSVTALLPHKNLSGASSQGHVWNVQGQQKAIKQERIALIKEQNPLEGL